MKPLSDITIYIGRDPGSNPPHLMIIAVTPAGTRNAIVPGADNVPATVSRCLTNNLSGHCKIEIDAAGSMRITNLKSSNTTYVDGMQITSMHLSPESRLTLGMDRYPVSLKSILDTAAGLVTQQPKRAAHPRQTSPSPASPSQPVVTPQPVLTGPQTPPVVTPQPVVAEKVAINVGKKKVPASPGNKTPSQATYSIRHLEMVWNSYEEGIEQIQRVQQERSKKRMLPFLIGSGSSVLSGLVGVFATPALAITLPVAVISFSMYLKNYREKDTSIEDRKALQHWCIENYVCPNPECRHFFGFQPFMVLRQNKKCPYCGCPLTL